MGFKDLEYYLSLGDTFDFVGKKTVKENILAPKSIQGGLITPLTIFAAQNLEQSNKDLDYFSSTTIIYNPDMLSGVMQFKYEQPKILTTSLKFDSASGHANDWARLNLIVEERSVMFDVVSVSSGANPIRFIAEYEGSENNFVGIARTLEDDVWCHYTDTLRFLGTIDKWRGNN